MTTRGGFAPINVVIMRLADADVLHIAIPICNAHGVLLEELAGRMRTKRIADARSEVWRALRNDPEQSWTYVQIAWLFGRHHSTIVNTINPGTKVKNVLRQRARWERIKAANHARRAEQSSAAEMSDGV